MATSSAKPFIINKAGVYKPSIGYQKSIDINYNDGTTLAPESTGAYRNSIKAVDTKIEDNAIQIGNYSNTKNTGYNKNLLNQHIVFLDTKSISLSKSIQNNAFNFITGKFTDDKYIIFNDPITLSDHANNQDIYSYAFAAPQKPHVENVPINNQQYLDRTQNGQKVNDQLSEFGTYYQYLKNDDLSELLPTQENLDQCTIWVCIKDI